MGKWLAREFDFTTGRYTGGYYNIAQAGIQARFVDSHFGNDTTGTGTPTNPYRTLGRAITDLNVTGANGSRIFMNGIFSENLPAQTFWYEYIGCGGGWNGRTVFFRDTSSNTTITFTRVHRYHNIQLLNYDNTVQVIPSNIDLSDMYFVNSILRNICASVWNGWGVRYHFHRCVVIDCILLGSSRNYILGNESILIRVGGILTIQASNCLVNNSPTIVNAGAGNVFNGSAQFIDELNNNYAVRITSPLLNAGTLDELTGIRANVGGVQVGLPYNGLTLEFTATGGAIISNLTLDNLGRYTLTPPARTGTLESANIDLGGIYPIERIDVFNIFDHFLGQITQGIFQPFTSPRMTLTIQVKYGNSAAEITSCPWLLMEYGKRPTFSGTGAGRLGNAAPTFDELNEQPITARFLRLFFTIQNNS